MTELQSIAPEAPAIADPGGVSPSPGRRWTRWVRIGVGVTLLALLATRVDLSQLSVRWSWLLLLAAGLAIALQAAAQALSALRWKVLLGPGSASWLYLLRLYLAAAFFSLFLPTSVGGDAVRAGAAIQSMGQPGRMVGTVLADRTLGVAALGLFFAVGLGIAGGLPGLSLNWTPRPATVALLAGSAMALAALGLALRHRLARPLRFVRSVAGAFVDLARRPRSLLAAVALGLAVQLTYVAAWIVLAWALGLALPLWSFLLTVPLVSLSAMAPITLSGVGVREGAWILLLKPYGVPAADALALSLLYFGCWVLVAALGGVWFSWRGTTR